MGEHKRIIVEDYPVEKLPEELRRNIEPGHLVTVTVEDGPQPAVSDFDTRLDRFWGSHSHLGTTVSEAVARIRELRDEKDER